MSLMIRNGLVMFMNGQAPTRADILLDGDRISQVEPHIGDLNGHGIRELDASGYVILPGLIDAHVHNEAEEENWIRENACSAGITSALLWSDTVDRCRLLYGGELCACSIVPVDVEHMRQDALEDKLITMRQACQRPICAVISEKQLQKALHAVKCTGIEMILVHLYGCDPYAEMVAAAGCPVILGVSRMRSSGAWAFAAKLDALGVKVAITCDYPSARLKYLSVCAGLCVRDGMPRERALQTITSNPADILGLKDVGRVEKGCRADLTIFDGDPLLLATSHVMTICGGKIYDR